MFASPQERHWYRSMYRLNVPIIRLWFFVFFPMLSFVQDPHLLRSGLRSESVIDRMFIQKTSTLTHPQYNKTERKREINDVERRRRRRIEGRKRLLWRCRQLATSPCNKEWTLISIGHIDEEPIEVCTASFCSDLRLCDDLEGKAQSTHNCSGMAPPSGMLHKSLHLLCFILSYSLCTITFNVFFNNLHRYSAYRQAERDAERFSMKTICRIDRTISRTQEDKSTPMLITNTTFLVSFEIAFNGNISTQQFEEWSVPVQFQPDVVGEPVSIKSPFLFNF